LTDDIDKAHSILVEWCGEFGVEIIRIFQDPWSEKSAGMPQLPEKTPCLVAQDGTIKSLPLLPNPYDQPPTDQVSWFATAYQTATSSCPSPSTKQSISSTAKASALSFVSYDDALAKATQLASQAAQNALSSARAQNPC
jgi:hypothetical protein